MMREKEKIWAIIMGMILSVFVFASPIKDYYKLHKKDYGMEARVIPPKVAAMIVAEDYPEAVDLLKSLSALKYLNYRGKTKKVAQYADRAIQAKGNQQLLLDEKSDGKKIKVFGSKKKGYIRKIMAVVYTKTQFVLLIGKGKLSESQIQSMPAIIEAL